jgi:DNA primase
MIKVRGEPLDIDVRAELEDFPWVNATWSDTRLIASSPFYYDRNPAFYVILDVDNEAYGCWGDSGADDPEYQRGGFVRLLSFLRDETYDETCDYLAQVYSNDVGEESAEFTLKIPQLLKADKPRVTSINSAILAGYKFRSPYLGGRGISEVIQRLMGVGYDRQHRAVTIPWFNPDGTLGNVKYRRTDSKAFWYKKGARPIREMIYGINVVYQRRIARVAIVEAEIDAMTLMSAGIPAIATGGTAFNSAKRDLILRSPIEELTLFRDNDSAGARWEEIVIDELCRKIDLRTANVPPLFKDVNEWHSGTGGYEDIRSAYADSTNCRNIAINIGCVSFM